MTGEEAQRAVEHEPENPGRDRVDEDDEKKRRPRRDTRRSLISKPQEDGDESGAVDTAESGVEEELRSVHASMLAHALAAPGRRPRCEDPGLLV